MTVAAANTPATTHIVSEDDVVRVQDLKLNFYTALGVAVSYTHLTLPTNREV